MIWFSDLRLMLFCMTIKFPTSLNFSIPQPRLSSLFNIVFFFLTCRIFLPFIIVETLFISHCFSLSLRFLHFFYNEFSTCEWSKSLTDLEKIVLESKIYGEVGLKLLVRERLGEEDSTRTE